MRHFAGELRPDDHNVHPHSYRVASGRYVVRLVREGAKVGFRFEGRLFFVPGSVRFSAQVCLVPKACLFAGSAVRWVTVRVVPFYQYRFWGLLARGEEGRRSPINQGLPRLAREWHRLLDDSSDHGTNGRLRKDGQRAVFFQGDGIQVRRWMLIHGTSRSDFQPTGRMDGSNRRLVGICSRVYSYLLCRPISVPSAQRVFIRPRGVVDCTFSRISLFVLNKERRIKAFGQVSEHFSLLTGRV